MSPDVRLVQVVRTGPRFLAVALETQLQEARELHVLMGPESAGPKSFGLQSIGSDIVSGQCGLLRILQLVPDHYFDNI